MKNKITESLLDSIKSVLPITLLIVFISLVIQIPSKVIYAFIISSILLSLGISFFTLGAEMSMIMIGELIGKRVIKRKSLFLVLFMSFIMGIVITISEPDLLVFASELTSIPNVLIILLVALGVGIYLMIGSFRIITKHSYRLIITISLLIILLILYFTPQSFMAIAFDGGGVTTGAMGVPLIVAFGYGIARIRSGNKAKEDSFGLCGLASLGPIIAILLLGLFFKTDSYFDTSKFINSLPLFEKLVVCFKTSFQNVIMSLLPILCVFIVTQIIKNQLTKENIVRMIIGLIFAILGLTMFLTGVSLGFIETGYRIGSAIANSEIGYLLPPIGMIMGYIIISAEPAVKILNKKISNLTEGSISEKMISLCLSIGVCLAIGLSLLRIICHIPITYIIVPGYFIACILMYYTPNIFMVIAFDSGGAASGAMTTSFLLPLCIGACEVFGGNIMTQAFGVISLVSLTPIITVELLGIIYYQKMRMKKSIDVDEEIIDYIQEA